MKSIDSLPGIATMGHPLIPPGPHAADRTPRELVGIMADRFGRPSGESWRGRVDGPSSTRWRPGRYGWSAECRARTERQVLECFVTANDPDAFRVLIERHGPMVLAVCRNVLRRSTTSRTPSGIRSWPWPGARTQSSTARPSARGSIKWPSAWHRRHGSRPPNVGFASEIAPTPERSIPSTHPTCLSSRYSGKRSVACQ